eukprot:1375529-Rhodomonas_salina.1
MPLRLLWVPQIQHPDPGTNSQYRSQYRSESSPYTLQYHSGTRPVQIFVPLGNQYGAARTWIQSRGSPP